MSAGQRRAGRSGRRAATGAGFVAFLLLGLVVSTRIDSLGPPSPEKQLIGSWELLDKEPGKVFTFRRDGIVVIDGSEAARYRVEENELVVEYYEGGNNPVRARLPFSIEGDVMAATENGQTARLRRLGR